MSEAGVPGSGEGVALHIYSCMVAKELVALVLRQACGLGECGQEPGCSLLLLSR